MAFARTIEDISRDLNEVKDEIKQVKLDIANPKSDADRVQDKIRLNYLYDKEKNLEKGRMFPPCLLLGFSHRSLLSFALFLFCVSVRFFLDWRCSGACAGKCRRWK